MIFFLSNFYYEHETTYLPCRDDIDWQLHLHCFHPLSNLQIHCKLILYLEKTKRFFFFPFYCLRTSDYSHKKNGTSYGRKEGWEGEMKKNKYPKIGMWSFTFYVVVILLSFFLFFLFKKSNQNKYPQTPL